MLRRPDERQDVAAARKLYVEQRDARVGDCVCACACVRMCMSARVCEREAGVHT